MSITYREYEAGLRSEEQIKGEEFLLNTRKCILGYEPGHGKTYPVVHAVLRIADSIPGCSILILSDANCIKNMWLSEIVTQDILPKNTHFYTDRKAIMPECSEFLLSRKWDVIVIDECHSLRSGITRAPSKYAKLVYKLTKSATWVFGMTGTVVGNNEAEILSLLHNLNIGEFGTVSFPQYKRLYCELETGYGFAGTFKTVKGLNQKGKQAVTYGLNRYVSLWSYGDDEMPPLSVNEIRFEVPYIVEFEDAMHGILSLGDEVSTFNKAAALIKAQELLNGFVYYTDQYAEQKLSVFSAPQCKIEHCIQSALEENCIIVYRFRYDLESLTEHLTNAGIKCTTSVQEFKETISKPGSDARNALMLQCGQGASFNLQECRNIIYYTMDFSFIAFKQMIHRCWRVGQTRPCKVDVLTNHYKHKGKIHELEHLIYMAVKKKEDLHALVNSIKKAEEELC